MRHILLVDPGVHSIQLDAVNLLCKLLAGMDARASVFVVALEQGKRRVRDLVLNQPPSFPVQESCEIASARGCDIVACDNVVARPCEAICSRDIAGIVSLGSDANVTQDLEWMRFLAADLRHLVFDLKIPFYGSCFSHQLLAFVAGAKVDYLKARAKNPDLMHKGHREIQVVHPKMARVFGTSEVPFCAQVPVWHSQEVWEIPPGFELAATSDQCEIDGLVHQSLPIFTLQTHPEWFHASGAGWQFLANFLALSLGKTL